MKQVLINNSILFLLVACLFSSCVKYDAAPFTGQSLPRITEYGNDWLYLNLETGKYLNPRISSDTVPRRLQVDGSTAPIYEGEHFERTDWDLAFNRFHFRTNSGTSGVGKGGVVDMGLKKFSQINTVANLPEGAEFVLDTNMSIIVSERQWRSDKKINPDNKPWFDPNTGPARILSSHNSVLSKVIVFAGPPPNYEPSNHIYIIRTADGLNYYKLHVISWYDEAIEIGDRDAKLSFYVKKLEK